ncbi:syntaxin-11-like [Mastacembelus armatus]|nr:syntaxin-11-like [Mastacembelus armatus]
MNYQALNKTSYPTASKHDSSTIGADIKRRAEAVLHQLHMLNAVRGELEAQRGRSDPVARIARTQYQCLSKDLQEVMFSYNDTEINHREACKRQMQRQMEVVGREVSEEELEEMLHSEELNVFSGQLQGQTVHSAFVQIESRHKELLALEKRITEIQELFLDVAVLTEEQGAAIENIQKKVQDTEMTVQDGGAHLVKAITYDKDHPFKKLFCGCFPCYNSR